MVLTVRRGRPIAPLTLTDNERTLLEQWSRRRTTAQALALRSRIVLAAAAGENNRTVAERLRVTEQTVGKWRRRFLERRLDGLSDEPRPTVPPTITDAQVEWVIAKTLEETPRGATQWSTRSMAEASGLSRASVWRIWRAFGLQPHRVESFKLSTDPFLVAKVRDIVGLYLDPPERAASQVPSMRVLPNAGVESPRRRRANRSHLSAANGELALVAQSAMHWTADTAP